MVMDYGDGGWDNRGDGGWDNRGRGYGGRGGRARGRGHGFRGRGRGGYGGWNDYPQPQENGGYNGGYNEVDGPNPGQGRGTLSKNILSYFFLFSWKEFCIYPNPVHKMV